MDLPTQKFKSTIKKEEKNNASQHKQLTWPTVAIIRNGFKPNWIEINKKQ